MKSEKKILAAFILNLLFSVFEFLGGLFTGSVAIISDSVHDFGDAISVGAAFLLEKKSKKQPDSRYSYGYGRYSVLSGAISSLILISGSAAVIYNAADRMIRPQPVNYDGMIVFAVFGVIVNLTAALFTKGGQSLGQKAVNLHMLEDVLGWIVVLAGAVVIKFTDFVIIDPIMSVCVAIFILINAVGNLKEAVGIFLEKTPSDLDIGKLKEHLEQTDGVLDVHHIHVFSMDGKNNYATMHIVTNKNFHEAKELVRKQLHEYGIVHSTLELESEDEQCTNRLCRVEFGEITSHHHHHHHHHRHADKKQHPQK